MVEAKRRSTLLHHCLQFAKVLFIDVARRAPVLLADCRRHARNFTTYAKRSHYTRRGKGDIEPELHGGAALIARMGKAPLIPITVRNAEKVKQKGKMVRFPKITMEFGEPVEVSDFDFLPKSQRLEGCSWYVMRDCFALSRRVSREEVDMTELFPHAKDYTEVFAEHPIHG